MKTNQPIMINPTYRRPDEELDLSYNKFIARSILESNLSYEEKLEEIAKRFSTSKVAEYDEAIRNGVERTDVVGCDLSDGTEVRSATLAMRGSRKKRPSFYFGNLTNKTGDLIARGFDPETGKLIRFRIPHDRLPTFLEIGQSVDGTWGSYHEFVESVEVID